MRQGYNPSDEGFVTHVDHWRPDRAPRVYEAQPGDGGEMRITWSHHAAYSAGRIPPHHPVPMVLS